MRTTIDIDSDVLQAAKEIATIEKRTAGEVISELARKGLTASGVACTPESVPFTVKDGWVTLQNRGDAIVTTELVERLLEEADWEDAGLRRSD